MRRWLIYTLLGLFMATGMPAEAIDGQGNRDRDKNAKNSAMRMKPKKRSKVAAKKRRQVNKDRQKHMAEIRKANKVKNR